MTEKILGHSDCLGDEINNPDKEKNNGFPVVFNGKTYLFSSLENRIKGQFEVLIRKKAVERIENIETFSPELAEKYRSVFTADLAAGKYNWGAETCMVCLRSSEGVIDLLYLLLVRNHKEIKREIIIEMMESGEETQKKLMQAYRWAISVGLGIDLDEEENKTKKLESEEPPTLD